MTHEIICELWKIKDEIACEHGCDLDSFSAYLRSRKYAGNQQVINLRAMEANVERCVALEGDTAALHPCQ